MSRPLSRGMLQRLPGSKSTADGWVAQNGQCSRWLDDAGASTGSPRPSATLTSVMPAALQISVQAPPLDAAMACEIEGARAANRIAKQVIQAARRRMIDGKTMPALYQRCFPDGFMVCSIPSSRQNKVILPVKLCLRPSFNGAHPDRLSTKRGIYCSFPPSTSVAIHRYQK